MIKKNELVQCGFWFYCPFQTFQEDNKDKYFKDEHGEIVSFSDTPASRDNPIELNSYFDKGFECFTTLITQLNEHSNGSAVNRESLDPLYKEIKRIALEVFDMLVEHKRVSKITDSVTGKKINFDEVRGVIQNAISADEAVDFFKINPELFNILPAKKAIYGFAALQHLDDIVLWEKWRGNDMPSREGAVIGFHESYFISVSQPQIETSILNKAAKERAAPATRGKTLKTTQRIAFIWKLFRKSGMTRKEFSHSTEALEQVNHFSNTIGLTALTPIGGIDTLYRSLSPKKEIT